MENIKFDYFQTMLQNVRFYLLQHGHLYADRSWNYHSFQVPYNRLYFVLDGEAEIENDRHRIELRAGRAYLIPARATYKLSCSEAMVQFYIHFRMEYLPGQDIFQRSSLCSSLPYDRELVNRLLHKVRSRHIGDILDSQSILQHTIAQFAAEMTGGLEDDLELLNKYKEVYGYVQDHCSAELTVSRMAAYLQVSPDTLSKQFKQELGYSLKSYISAKLTERIKELLLLTDLTINEIAGELRFSDEFYMSGFFKKHVGLSPKAYRLQQKMVQ